MHPYRTNTRREERREPAGYAIASLAFGVLWTVILVTVSRESLSELPVCEAVAGAVALLLPHALVIIASLARLVVWARR
jgi:hypothetical protein